MEEADVAERIRERDDVAEFARRECAGRLSSGVRKLRTTNVPGPIATLARTSAVARAVRNFAFLILSSTLHEAPNLQR
jgi:hypothetical protein